MLYVGASNRIENLVTALLGEMQAQRTTSGKGFYEKIHILTPNPTTNKYLEFELARRSQITANLAFTHLHKFLGTMAGKHPELTDVTVLNRAKIQVLIDEVLQNPAQTSRPELARVLAYMQAVQTPQGQEVRRYQLSLQLARLFEEYDYSRQEMLAAWAQNQNYFEDESTEIWQRFIWYSIFGNTRIVQRNEKRFMPLSKVFETYHHSNEQIPGVSRLHIFGFQHISPMILNAFQSLARNTEIYLWMLQPGTVETAETSEPQPWKFQNNTHLAITQWAASASDMLTALSQSGASLPRLKSFHEVPALMDSSTALDALHADIFELRPSRPTASELGDSVVFHDCPGIQREIEVVANDIWTRVLESDGKLRFHEISVVVAGADREEYVAQIRSVFKSFHNLPRSFVGLPNAEKSPVVEAFAMLLNLPFTNFGRRTFMGLLLHPNVQASVPGSDPLAWTKWCENLSILFGADQKHQGDTYIEKDFYNWSQGLKRLAAGTFLGVETDGKIPENGSSNTAPNTFEHGGQTYLVEAVKQSHVADAARMSMLANSLIEDARWLHDAAFPLTTWAQVFEDLLTTYILPATHHPPGGTKSRQEYGDIGICKHLIQSLIERDITGSVVSYRTASLMLLTELDALHIAREGELHRGIVVGTPARLSHIPFKHTYIVGAGEGQFPAVDREDPMDLRQAQRTPGPETSGEETARDRDRQAFLDIVLNARESLSMSWVARDATTAERLEPSSLLYELKSCLKELLTGEPKEIDEKLKDQKHPLRRYDAPHTLHPEAQIEARLVEIGLSLREQTKPAGKALPPAFTVAEHLRNSADPRAEKVEKWLQMPPGLQPSLDASATTSNAQRSQRPLRISLSQLRSFLESPLQGAAKIQLRMNEEQDDALLLTHEPFIADRMNGTVFLRRVFQQAVLQGIESVAMEKLYDEMLLPFYELNGTLPTGFFLEKTRREHLRVLGRWKFYRDKWIKSQHWKKSEAVQVFRFGPEEHEAKKGIQRLDPLQFELTINGVVTVAELVGTTEMFCTESRSLITCVTRDKPNKKHFSRGYASYLALAASGHPATRILVNFASAANSSSSTMDQLRGELSPVKPDDAYQFLKTILQEIFSKSHAYLLPIDMLNDYFKASEASESFDAQSWIVNTLDNEYSSISDQYGPIKGYADFQAPPDWKELLHQRFQYFPGFPAEGSK